MTGKLIIARHGESEWNHEGRWTGSANVGLTDYGFDMSRKMGDLLKDFLPISKAFASAQIRSLETLLCMEDDICIDVPITRSAALNERDYGDYTGKNKWEVEKEIGEEAFEMMRRDWDCPVPHGETLKVVYDRVVPYYLETILPAVLEGKTVLVVAHGNSLRALIKYIENIADADMGTIEMPFGTIFTYELDSSGHSTSKEIRSMPVSVPA
jgi:2,3-bisphosphoglycerate-dependent phosphoglycerate mutase